MYASERLGIVDMLRLFVARGGFIERRTLRGLLTDTIIFTGTVLFSLVVCRLAEWASLHWTTLALFAHQYTQQAGPMIFGAAMVVAVFVCTLMTTHVANATAGINQELSFEGKVVDSSGQNITDGNHNMEFKLYSGGTQTGGGTLMWTEDWLVSNSDAVTFTSGTFQVDLGQFCPFAGGACSPSNANDGNTNTAINWNSYPLYLSIQVGNTSSCTPTSNNFQAICGGDSEMKPYILLTSSPYAFNADKLDGIDSSGFVQLSPGSQQSGNINISGTVTSGAVNGISIGSTIQPSASGALTVSSNGSNALTLTGGAASTLSTTSGNLTLQAGSGTVTLGSSTSLTATGALTVQSGGSSALTLTSASGTIALGSGTIQRSATGLTLDVTNASNSTLSITNSGAGSINVSVDAGGSYTGAGAVNLTSGGATVLSLDTGGGAAINIGGTNATSIVLGGNTAATLTEKVANSSTTAFTLQTAGGTNLLVADTTNSRLYVGGSASAATPILLVFGLKTATGDPTGVNGAEYYNSANNKFRCDQGGTWVNCLPASNSSTADQAVAGGSTAYLTGSSIAIPGGGLHAGTQFMWKLSVSKTAAGTATSSFLVKYGTNGSTADTTELTFTGPTETAAADTAQITIILTVRSVNSSTGTWTGNLAMSHTNASTGFTASTAQWVSTLTTGNFNDTTAGAIVGLAVTTGTADAFTFQQVQATATNL